MISEIRFVTCYFEFFFKWNRVWGIFFSIEDLSGRKCCIAFSPKLFYFKDEANGSFSISRGIPVPA